VRPYRHILLTPKQVLGGGDTAVRSGRRHLSTFCGSERTG